jgi:integrase
MGISRYKGGPRYRISIDIGRDPITGKRERYTEVLPNREAAKARAKEIDALYARKAPTTKAVTVGEVLERYYRAMTTAAPGAQAQWSPITSRTYRARIDQLLAPAFGDLPLSELTVAGIERYYLELQTVGRRVEVRGKRRPLSPRTVRSVNQVLTGALDDAVRYGEASENVARRVRLPRTPNKSDERQRRSIPTSDEIRTVLEAADQNQADLIRLALGTGRRLGELAGIQWREVDLEAGTVRICRTISADAADELVVLEDDRRKSPAVTLPIDAATVAMLRARRARAVERALTFGARLDARAFVFSESVDGAEPVGVERLSQRFRRLTRRAGVGTLSSGLPFRFHDLRHWHVSILLARGLDLQSAADRAGHVDLSTTQIYTHSVPGQAQRAAEIIGLELGEIAGA